MTYAWPTCSLRSVIFRSLLIVIIVSSEITFYLFVYSQFEAAYLLNALQDHTGIKTTYRKMVFPRAAIAHSRILSWRALGARTRAHRSRWPRFRVRGFRRKRPPMSALELPEICIRVYPRRRFLQGVRVSNEILR